MNESVLNLGEKVLLAARLAAIEHVRQELDAAHRFAAEPQSAATASVGEAVVGDGRPGVTDDPAVLPLSRPVTDLLADYFGQIEKTATAVRRDLPRKRTGSKSTSRSTQKREAA